MGQQRVTGVPKWTRNGLRTETQQPSLEFPRGDDTCEGVGGDENGDGGNEYDDGHVNNDDEDDDDDAEDERSRC
eukprot:5746363-Pyramimonas_sp.AAC.1